MKWRYTLGDKSTLCHDKEREKLGTGHVWLVVIGKPINVYKMYEYSERDRLLFIDVISLAFMWWETRSMNFLQEVVVRKVHWVMKCIILYGCLFKLCKNFRFWHLEMCAILFDTTSSSDFVEKNF